MWRRNDLARKCFVEADDLWECSLWADYMMCVKYLFHKSSRNVFRIRTKLGMFIVIAIISEAHTISSFIIWQLKNVFIIWISCVSQNKQLVWVACTVRSSVFIRVDTQLIFIFGVWRKRNARNWAHLDSIH